MPQKPVVTLSGCQPICVNTLLCDTLGLAEKISSVWIENVTRSIGIELFQSQGPPGREVSSDKVALLFMAANFRNLLSLFLLLVFALKLYFCQEWKS